MTTTKKTKTPVRTLITLLLILLITACASPGIRGKAPFVQLNGLHLQDTLLNLDLGVRNVNTEALILQQIEFSISLGDTSLAIYKAASQASISANGTENFRFELNPSSDGVALLNALQSGETPNLEYSLKGMMLVQENDELQLQRKGHIFPVPGRPGHFR